jgi:O-antigen/teichoic acid export membrane protein
MLGFAGWSLLPNLATVCYSQGINIILNLFFGPAVNAARGVSVQVQGIVKNFVTNFQTAVTPQIIKSYASNDVDRLNKLVFNSSKLSFYLLLCIALPVFMEAEYLLDIWLKDVPEHTVSFLRLILLAILLDPLANPLCVANNATGDIKKFKMWEAGICVSVIPIGYILLKLGLRPESVFVAQIILSGIVQFARVALSRGFLHFTFKTYLKNVIYYVIGVILIAPITPLLLYHFLPKGFGSFLLVSAVCVLSVVVCSYFIGFNASERETIRYKVSNFLMRR